MVGVKILMTLGGAGGGMFKADAKSLPDNLSPVCYFALLLYSPGKVLYNRMQIRAKPTKR